MAGQPVTIKGHVRNLTFFNEENGYFVAKVETSKGLHTVIGYFPAISEGEYMVAEGVWQQSQWGPQIKADKVSLSKPTMSSAIEKYLCASVKGIGKTFAAKLVKEYGDNLFDVIENHPEKLLTLHGIGKKKVESLVSAYNSQRAIREIMVFLHKAGLTAAKAKTVYDTYGDTAIAKITENPYLLSKDIWGVGFKIADNVAANMGIAPTSDHRIKAGLQYVLTKATEEGSCGLPQDETIIQANELLGVGHPLIEKAIASEIRASNLFAKEVDGVMCLFSPSIYYAERQIASLMKAHLNQPVAYPIVDIQNKVAAAEKRNGIVLQDKQRAAVILALQSQCTIITGGPGCGKTTLTRIILDVMNNEGLSISVAAPTGKAADRASEATGFAARTIHRMLGFNASGGFIHNQDNKLDTDVLVLDECSMLDVPLTLSVLQALHPRTRLIMLGDIDQLPSVGPGKVLADFIASDVIPYVRLTYVWRQGAGSKIKENAARINAGEMPIMQYEKGDDFVFIPFSPQTDTDEAKEACRRQMVNAVLNSVKNAAKMGFHPIKEVQVLTPMRKGILGVENLNTMLQKALNPAPLDKIEIRGVLWGTGDKVMQLRNNYQKEVFNGDVGFITEINTFDKNITIEYSSRTVKYLYSEMDEVSLAYVYTIHKSQGSESPALVLVTDTSHHVMLKRNLLYTGMTRCKKLLQWVANPSAVRTGVKNSQIEARYSLLKYWLLNISAAE